MVIGPPRRTERGARMSTSARTLTHLDDLEAEAIHIFREVAAELERPVLLFSGGKDSLVLLRLAEKAFRPGKFPFPVMHVDTGHNFPEVIEFRDRRVRKLDERLIVASVQKSIDEGRVVEETGPRASRNRFAQTTTLLDAIEERQFDAAIGGARRDEERARATSASSRSATTSASESARAAPEAWNVYNARVRKGEHVRVFPISNWTELDVWQYVAREQLELPRIYFAHEREVFKRDGMLYAASDYVERLDTEEPFARRSLPHCRRHDLHRRRRLGCGDDRRGRRRDRRDPRDRARRDARRRPIHRSRDGGPPKRVGYFFEQAQQAELLRLVTCGSVDDGESTLIGRLLYDTKRVSSTRYGAHRGDVEAPRRRLRQPGAAHRRSPGRARAGHHDRRRVPVRRHADGFSSRTRPGTSSTHATW